MRWVINGVVSDLNRRASLFKFKFPRRGLLGSFGFSCDGSTLGDKAGVIPEAVDQLPSGRPYRLELI
jgi:hypothetical protein